MKFKKLKTLLSLSLPFILSAGIISNAAYATDSTSTSSVDLRLYTLDCGYHIATDAAPLFNKDFYPHQPLRLSDPCFLIKHNSDWMLWDLGLGDQYVGKGMVVTKYKMPMAVPVRLTTQLEKLGLTPDKIKYVALSHTHFDHTGNANLFPNARWIMQDKEYQFAENPSSFGVADGFSKVLSAIKHKTLLNGDYDVFSDGTVKIISTPGHTPGHESLVLKLPHEGVVILSGDVALSQLGYLNKQIPSFNTSPKESLDSMARVDLIQKETHARLVIPHDLVDATLLPKFPKYLN